MPRQRIKEQLETMIDGKKMQDLYIHNMVSVEHIIWLREMKMIFIKEKKEEKTGVDTNKRITGT